MSAERQAENPRRAVNGVDVMDGRSSLWAPSATMKGRTLLRRCPSYLEAQRVVDFLSDQQFPVEHTAIVARNLSCVEKVTGRLTWGTATLRGASIGLLFGFFTGLFLGLFVIETVGWLILLSSTAVCGATVGGLFSLVGYWSLGGRRDFDSLREVTAESFDVLVDESHQSAASHLLSRRFANPR